ncbi:MAG: DUF3307 domain-containing protein [Tissierellia bacterium]|nr:DUF3307 domain-containing protein [Tissierellia bacterium]
MNEKSIIMIFLIAHFFGDYYFQSDRVAKEKSKNFKQFIYHCLTYSFFMFMTPGVLIGFKLVWISFYLSVAHFIVDLIKRIYDRKSRNKFKIYILDQILHIVSIIFVAIFLSDAKSVEITGFLIKILNVFGLDFLSFVKIILSSLIIIKPASVTIRLILDKYQLKNIQTFNEGLQNAGNLIGILERMIILLFLAFNHFSAVGFVLTAKSIARYEKITKIPEFSEYYLLGTLLSSLIVILVRYTILIF